MELVIVIVFIIVSAFAGTVFGYFLRWIVSLGKKGSMELKIKQMILEAKDEAQRITDEAEEKAQKLSAESRVELKEQVILKT